MCTIIHVSLLRELTFWLVELLEIICVSVAYPNNNNNNNNNTNIIHKTCCSPTTQPLHDMRAQAAGQPSVGLMPAAELGVAPRGAWPPGGVAPRGAFTWGSKGWSSA